MARPDGLYHEWVRRELRLEAGNAQRSVDTERSADTPKKRTTGDNRIDGEQALEAGNGMK